MHFSHQELQHYSRQINLSGFGLSAQANLKKSRVLVVGAGGLGSPVLLFLASAGVGSISIVDHDLVDRSNLQRQVLFQEADIGLPKAEVAANKLHAMNSNIQIKHFSVKLDANNASELFSNVDVVVDATDNFETRYLIDELCAEKGIPMVYGSVFRFEGQVSVFNQLHEDGSRGPRYIDFHPEAPPEGLVPNCATDGVLGSVAGTIGVFQATEVIKLITGVGETLSGKMLVYDLLNHEQHLIKLQKNSTSSKSSNETTSKMSIKEVSVQELKTLMDEGKSFQLIDVREPFEYEQAEMGGELIPLNQIPESADKIAKDKQVIIHCRSGKRSADAVAYLQQHHGFDNLYNLKGGIIAWSQIIDPNVQP
ncbi:MAG: ThiF family adenylyltransferase [Flavobacteriales bacterium]